MSIKGVFLMKNKMITGSFILIILLGCITYSHCKYIHRFNLFTNSELKEFLRYENRIILYSHLRWMPNRLKNKILKVLDEIQKE